MMKTLLLLISIVSLLVSSAALADEQEIKMLLTRPFVKAEFTKIRKLKILSRPFTTSGKILFLPEKGLVWQTLKPIEDTLLIGLDGVSQIKRGNPKLVQINNPVVKSASAVFITVLSLDLDRIKSIFTIREGVASQDKKSYTLIPRDETLRKVIKHIELSGKERVEKIHIQELNGDSTTVMLENESLDKSVLSSSERQLLEMM